MYFIALPRIKFSVAEYERVVKPLLTPIAADEPFLIFTRLIYDKTVKVLPYSSSFTILVGSIRRHEERK